MSISPPTGRTFVRPKSPPPWPAHAPGGHHVLAVGSPGPSRELLTRTLRLTGYAVTHAVPGDVHRQVRQAPPDAIVALDDGPDGRQQGLDVIREVRADPAGQALPLLMVTAARNPAPATVADLLRQGADDCLPEACDPRELSARIAAKLHRVPVPVEHLPRDPRTGLWWRARRT